MIISEDSLTVEAVVDANLFEFVDACFFQYSLVDAKVKPCSYVSSCAWLGDTRISESRNLWDIIFFPKVGMRKTVFIYFFFFVLFCFPD